jgi:RNA-directed DNA polymerase
MIYEYSKKHTKFQSLTTELDVAKFLSIRLDVLDKLLINPTYHTFEIPKKKGGFRTITSPVDVLKQVQKKIAVQLQQMYVRPKSVYGFVSFDKKEHKSPIVENAKNHVAKKYILSVDIHHFFESILTRSVYQLFLAEPFNFSEKTALILTRLTTYKGCLPTGAPTSPILSNFIFLEIDELLETFANEQNSVYTRYADDLTFSSDLTFSECYKIRLQELIHPFTLSYPKTRVKKFTQQQKVTGVVVNKKVNVDRKWIKKLRAMLYDLEKNGLEKAAHNHFKVLHKENFFLNRIQGNIAFLGQVRGVMDPEYCKYRFQFNELLQKNQILKKGSSVIKINR